MVLLFDIEKIELSLKNQNFFDKIIIVEDHLKSGGFGSWLTENISKNEDKINFFCIKNTVIGEVGSEEYLLKNIK